jgi:cystathionine gamma-synthase
MPAFEVKPIETPYLHAIPAPNGVRSPHAITTHLHGWKHVMKFVEKDPVFLGSFIDMYPRLIPHRDVKKVH